MWMPLSLPSLCNDLFVLNILAREGQLMTDKYVVYALKDSLIEYLYQHGYCRQVVEHFQDRECWACGGDGCFRCNAGIYSRIVLYAFRFYVGGRSYKWHMPKRRINFPVTLTEPDPEIYRAPAVKRPEHRGEDWMLLNLWLGLKLRGASVPKFSELEILTLPIPARRRLRFWYHYRYKPFVIKTFKLCPYCEKPLWLRRFDHDHVPF